MYEKYWRYMERIGCTAVKRMDPSTMDWTRVTERLGRVEDDNGRVYEMVRAAIDDQWTGIRMVRI